MSDLEERLIAEGLCPVCAEMGHNGCATEYAADLRARLAAVEALCDDLAGDIEHSRVHGDGPAEYRNGWQHGVQFAADQVRAAARGEA